MPKTNAVILDGKAIREKIVEDLKKKIHILKAKHGDAYAPKLATIQIGESKDVDLYFNYLEKLFGKFEIPLLSKKFPGKTEEIPSGIFQVYENASVTGILIFSPMITSLAHQEMILYRLPLHKDVEGRKFMKNPTYGIFSPTANAVMEILKGVQGLKLVGKNAVVVGHSDLVGKPVAISLLDEGATVTVCHKDTTHLAEHIGRADILVSAVGRPNLIKGDWIKPGAVIVDVGESVLNGVVTGDVEFEGASAKAAAITPVPGGVGPITNLMLVTNLLRLYEDKMNHANH